MERNDSTTTITASKEERYKNSKTEHEEEDDHDVVSLSDFPLNTKIKEENYKRSSKERNATQVGESETQDQEFVFGSTESEMCAADELFFQGQILPLRLSVSSEHGLNLNLTTGFKTDIQNASQCLSRSESMDHIGSMGRGFRSNISSRSNSYSSRSTQRSSSISSSNGSSSTIAITRVVSESRVPRNHFQPSPKPQIRASSVRVERVSSRNQKSSFWDFFRLGLVRTPDMDLQEMKIIRSNSSVQSKNRVKGTLLKEEKQSKMKFLSGCKSSVNQTVDNSNVIITKNRSKSSTSTITETESVNVKDADDRKLSTAKKVMEDHEKVEIELKKKKMQKLKQQGKQDMSHHRTYEWLKQLSHANFPSYV